MRAGGVVELEVAGELLLRLGHAVVCVQIDMLVLHAPPQSLDEHVVHPSALAVHADLHVVILEHLGELDAGELASLVGVEDLRWAVLGERFDAEIRGHADRHSVRQNLARRPIQDRHQEDESALHRDIGNVGRPDLVRTVDRPISHLTNDCLGHTPAVRLRNRQMAAS